MQSMIASQQQLIRRNINNSNSNNGINNTNRNQNGSNSNISCEEWSQSSLSSCVTGCGDDSHINSTLSAQQSTPTPTPTSTPTPTPTPTSLRVNSEANQSFGSDLSVKSDLKSDVKTIPDKSQVKKKRSNNSWLNILSPSYKTRHEEFKRLFSNLVPNNERLVVDYSCALQKEILIHGRLYLSLNYIAFYANIFKWETSLVIKCRDITSMNKANTARVIPNAIQVITNSGDKYVFTSFAARDKTHVMLFRIWQNALLDQPMSSSELWQWVHYSYGEDLGLTSSDDEEYYNDNVSNTLTTHSQVRTLDNSDSCTSSDPDFGAKPEIYEDCLDQMQCNTSECKCLSHNGNLILNTTFPVGIDRVFELIFTDNKFIHNLHKSRRTYDLVVTEWEDSECDKWRQLNYTVALNHTLVKSARTIETQTLLKDSVTGNVYMIRSVADNEGVPYCDTFSMHSQWCLTQDSENVTRLKVHAKVFYKKNIWGLGFMKPMIEKSSIQGITDFCNDLTHELSHWIEMERNLTIVTGIKDLKINTKNIDYIDSVSSISSINNSLIENGIDVTEKHRNDTTLDLVNNRNGIFANIFNQQLNDAFLLKLILSILLLIFVLNIMVFIIIWQIETKMQTFDSVSFANSQIADNSTNLKQFIDNAIKMIKVIETNLLQLKHSIKDEL